MKKIKYLITLVYLSLALAGLAQQPFTAGNIVVFRIGNGTADISDGNNYPVFLDEFTPAGVLVQSIAMPTTASGGNNILTASAAVIAQGNLNLSANGKYLVVSGQDAAAGSANGSHTAAVIGIVNSNGNVNTSTAITNNLAVGGNSGWVGSAISDDGNRLWFHSVLEDEESGDISGLLGYTTVGSNSCTVLYSDFFQFFYSFNIAGGQLYVSNNIANHFIDAVGTGLPTTAGQTLTHLPGLPTSGLLPNQFAFVDLDPGVAGVDVLYFTDNGNTPTGIRKYSLVGGTWTSNGSVGAANAGYAGLTLSVSGSTVTLFATRLGNAGGGDLVKLTDNSGYNATLTGTPTVLSSIPTRFGTANFAAYRGVAFVPQENAVRVSAKIFLQGAYSTTFSRHKDVSSNWATALNNNALSQPYNTAAFGNYTGTETVAANFFASTAGDTDITDWVLVELRDATTPATLIARRAAFVREDGKVVDLDGTSDVLFDNVNSGNYYIVIRHRNHLGVRSAAPVALSGTATTYDFTTAQAQAYQNPAITTNEAMKDISGTGAGPFIMWGGNGNSNTSSRSSGGLSLNDYLYLTSTVLGGNISLILGPPSTAVVYNNADMNMDGAVRASGGLSLNDYLFLTSTVLGGNISLILNQHL